MSKDNTPAEKEKVFEWSGKILYWFEAELLNEFIVINGSFHFPGSYFIGHAVRVLALVYKFLGISYFSHTFLTVDSNGEIGCLNKGSCPDPGKLTLTQLCLRHFSQ